ncbi:MAG TPA: serine/threonine-protein kinase [Vicinamibacterales bacterium]|nr:serine/threonine-protein kinase [Vicinamibacterales bacterium]
MTADEWARVRGLFDRALDEGGENPRAWVERQSHLDERIRNEVIALFEHEAAAGSFLEEPPPFQSPPSLQPGVQLGPYQIVREAGQGGSGRVYVAIDGRLGRRVALKSIRTLGDKSSDRERLRREALAAASLTHPGICTVYALEELDDDLFLATEFVEGRTLRQEIASGPLTIARVDESARAIAEALASAHDRGVIHGDLKPENVMRTYDGRVKILDFGLARLERAEDAGRSWVFAGTPGYMAPELINGQNPDLRSDVFALGVLLYEIATGTHPFAAATAAEMERRVLMHDPTPVATTRSDLQEPLLSVIERCLRKAPAERFASASEISRLVGANTASPVSSRARQWWRIHHAVVIVLYATAALVSWRVAQAFGPGNRAANGVFAVIGIAATIGTIVRGHLLFTEGTQGLIARRESRRTALFTIAIDLVIALGIAVDSAIVAQPNVLSAVLMAALAVGLILARLLIEPSTTLAAFPE